MAEAENSLCHPPSAICHPLSGTRRAAGAAEAVSGGVWPSGAPGKRRRLFVSKRLSLFFVVALLLCVAAMPALAGPVPSKTAANQSLDSREADLTVVRSVAANDQVAAVLTAHGFTQAQVDQRLAQMSPQDLHQLAQNLEQLQPAGMTKQEWIWIGIGALAALILVIALAD
jgi:hypothetical protein